ncbi:Qat anti-phage system TatD family nuclease QatD [Acinetobacter bereziniae]|jgi:TatD DNase family protein|uniref:Qat anti-phage system TatD family nuclease QatD n=1 Tax=Acinetobacter bereziniae TaxID=106648 RepID=UPI0012507CF2|nr:Qat anti-phage system TatD family nuclease QatD [Acinetobacter bereziniae]MCU4314439.1 TatD family hydrolase [Acinetobacter bereziniae]
MFPLIDFHCHLDLYDNPQAVVSACGDSNYILSVTTTPKAWFGTKKLAENHKRIQTALGLHPQIAHERYKELDLFDLLINETKYIGEIGLDGSSSLKPYQNIQSKVFKHILRKANSSSAKILTIHSLNAVEDTLQGLESYFHNGIPVLHWYTGKEKDLKRAIDRGCWFSINQRMLASDRGRLLVSQIPKDRILTETDGPFITNKNQPIQPASVMPVIKRLGDLWQQPQEIVIAQIFENLKKLLISVN